MLFYEKLTFLMNLTRTSNRLLAQWLQVDPSLISRLHTGARAMPRDRDQVRSMALCLAKRCTTEYQRRALSEMLGVKPAVTMDSEQCATLIYQWFCDDADGVGRLVRSFEEVRPDGYPDIPRVRSRSLGSSTGTYFGNEGKRAAARAVYQHLLTLETGCTIFLHTDEADDWITEDHDFPHCLQTWAVDLIRRGFRFCQIAPPVRSVDQAFDSLIRWLPVYITGKVDAYFYPRLRDNVHRRSLFVVPGEIVMSSTSIAGQSIGHAAIVSTEHRLTLAYSAEFQDHLSLCRPMLRTYTTPESLMKCLTRFLAADGARIHKIPSLSVETAPPELMARCIGDLGSEDRKRLGALFFQEMESIREAHNTYSLIDLAYLATAEEVRAGGVPILFSHSLDSAPLCYTPETYVLHLKNILHIMERCECYHFVPLPRRPDTDGILLTKEDRQALLIHTSTPFATFQIDQSDIVRLCSEHLLRTAEQIGYTGIHRVKIMALLRERIRELQP